MSRKKITRARVKTKKGSPAEEFLNLGLAIFNRHQLKFKGHKSLYYALISFDRYKDKDLFSYMNECIKYDELTGNKNRIKEWNELKEKDLSADEILLWADKVYEKEIERLIKLIKEGA